jgi:outer membrane immunogenic protein
MKRLVGLAAALALLTAASPAIATDLPTKGPVYTKAPAAALFNWTGWYGGFNYGTGVAHTRGRSTGVIGSFDRADSGYSVGVQVGYNWQYHPHWAASLEADINWLGIDRYRQDWNEVVAFGVETDWYATLRVRLGYTSSPSLFYVTGGGAWVKVENRADIIGGVQASRSETASGWAGGWGIETVLGGNWTAKAEYLYIDAGDQDVVNPNIATGLPTHFDNRFHVFRKGLNYRFGGGQAPALPAYNWDGFYTGLFVGAGA